MEELTDLVEMYKNGKLTKFSMESELAKFIDIVTYSTVSLETSVVGNDNVTYIAGVLPESINGDVKVTFVLDDHLVKTLLEGDELEGILTGLKSAYPKAITLLNDFIRTRKGSEVPMSECIALYAKIYKLGVQSMPADVLRRFAASNSYNERSIDDILLALDTGNETIAKVVEYATVMHVMPKSFLFAAERLFKMTNVPAMGSDIKAMDVPEENVLYAHMAQNSTGLINPMEKHELDPFYVAKTQ
jgi:hypothetical protein